MWMSLMYYTDNTEIVGNRAQNTKSFQTPTAHIARFGSPFVSAIVHFVIQGEQRRRALHSPTDFHGVHEDSVESPKNLHGLHEDSTETPQRLHEDSMRTPWNISVDSTWTPHGLLVDS